ncbi:hypothetical protein FHR99_000729 [Litorivivens lipolytica]|uniref:Preprotein translocase subunit YajC n=1 Tax=Litorivivens lipolytica TaxID=1524264 RepID=A0A7W4W2Z2_9GAMM|nr:hypothetical protein [Litorivivens lipolytica]MBB3046493.1 hypothetical protein [Litorivivens lipolytica]
MTWLIAFFVVAFVVAPVIWVMPTPAQRRQARIRQHAHTLGLSINIVELPQSRRAQVRKEGAQLGVRYCLPIKREKNVYRPQWLLWRVPPEGEDDVPPHCPKAVSAQADALRARMAEDVVALESGPEGYAVFWRERGEEEAVDRVAALLEDVRQLAGGERLVRK